MNRHLKSGVIAATLVATAVLALRTLVHDGVPFDALAWRRDDHFRVDESSTRNEMIDDLLANRLAPGMEETDVLDLLGQPTFESEGRLEYWVDDDYGQWWDFNLSPDPLRIRYVSLAFDANRKLVSAARADRGRGL